MSMEIRLTQDKVAIVDDEDYERISQHKWCTNKIGGNHYAVRGNSQNRKLMHREIMNAPRGKVVHHLNHNTLDNRKANLMIVSHRQNSHSRIEKKYSSYPGVCWHKTVGKWVASITINGRLKHLGVFENELDAAKKYEAVHREEFGEELLCKEILKREAEEAE